MPQQPQSFANHVSRDLQHLPAMAFLALNVVVALVWAFVAGSPGLPLRMWVVLLAVALAVSSLKSRTNAVRVQDRVIRLEELLRYQALLSHEQATAARALPLNQRIALRFASDAELPGLLDRTLAEHLSPRQIKQAVQNWRADTHRV